MRIAVKLTMIFVLWFRLTPGETAEDVSKCNATAADLTTEATVTCLFPVSITKSRLGFRVHHNQNYLSESVVVVNCMWMSGMLDCDVKSGYEAGNLTSESFTLRIPHFLPNHTGGYLCDLDGYYNESCTLHQLAGTTGTQGFAIVSAVAAPAVIAPATVLLIVIIIIIIIAFTQYRLRRKRHIHNSRTPGQDKNDITDTDQREELINQREECGSDRHLPSLRSMATTSCETCSRQLSAFEEHGQQASLGNTYEVSSTSQKSLSRHADVISAMTALCTEVVKQNAATKLSCQLDADGSLQLVCESCFSSPRVIPEQEPVSLGQLKNQSESPYRILAVNELQEQTSPSPDKTCSVKYKENEGTSIAVQEEVTANVHLRNFDSNTYEHQEGDSISLKQTCNLEMLPTSDDDSHTKPSLPRYSY